MDIIYTILIIIGALIIAPFVALAYISILGGAIIGFIFFLIVTLMGVEGSMAVLVTCMIAGVVVVVLAGVGSAVEQRKNTNQKK